METTRKTVPAANLLQGYLNGSQSKNSLDETNDDCDVEEKLDDTIVNTSNKNWPTAKSKPRKFDYKSLVCNTNSTKSRHLFRQTFSPIVSSLSKDVIPYHLSSKPPTIPSNRMLDSDILIGRKIPRKVALEIDTSATSKQNESPQVNIIQKFSNLGVSQDKYVHDIVETALKQDSTVAPKPSSMKSPRKVRKRLRQILQVHKPEEIHVLEHLVETIQSGSVDEEDLLSYLSQRYGINAHEHSEKLEKRFNNVSFNVNVEKVQLEKLGSKVEPELGPTNFLGKQDPSSRISARIVRGRRAKKKRRTKRLTPEDKEVLYEWRRDLNPLFVLAHAAPKTPPPPIRVFSKLNPRLDKNGSNMSGGMSSTSSRLSNASGGSSNTSGLSSNTSSRSPKNSQGTQPFFRGLGTNNAYTTPMSNNKEKQNSGAVSTSPRGTRLRKSVMHNIPSPRGRNLSVDDPFQLLSGIPQNRTSKSSTADKTAPTPMSDKEIQTWSGILRELGERSRCNTKQNGWDEHNFATHMQNILDMGFPVDHVGDNGKSLLLTAIDARSPLLISKLLEHGASIYASSDLEQSAFHYALNKGSYAAVQEILVSANIPVTDRVKLVNEAGSNGELPIHTAAKMRTEEAAVKFVELLIQFKANASATDSFLKTALHYACEHDFEQVIRVLLKHIPKISYNAKDFAGCTPLHIAARNNSMKSIKVLLAVGANPTVKNLENKTPLDLAIEENNEASILALVK